MALIAYRGDGNNEFVLNKLRDQLSTTATLTSVNGLFSAIRVIDALEGDGNDLTVGGNLDTAMEELGFTRLSGSQTKIFDQIQHWGSFEVADAPTLDLTTGDMAFCTNGDAGVGRPVYWDGVNWRVVYNNNIISAT